MSYDGPEVECHLCGWSSFTIRKTCRNCGTSLPVASPDTGGGGQKEVTAFPSLRAANVARQTAWRAGGDPIPDLAFRGNELAGETGEACNVIKKLERERHGWRGSRDTVEHLAEELADVVICADLVALTAGIDLDAAVAAKFNATSEKVGLPHRLAIPKDQPPPVARVAAGKLEAEADRIVTRLYRRFKDWSKRGFGPSDVTWCEVKADILALITPRPAFFPAAADVAAGQDAKQWRHRKRGTTHSEICRADLQASSPVGEAATLVIYQGDDGRIWAREQTEFDDGRFELLPVLSEAASVHDLRVREPRQRFRVSALVFGTVDLGTFEATNADEAERAAMTGPVDPTALCLCCDAKLKDLALEHTIVEPAP